MGSNLELERLRPKLGSIGMGYKGVSVASDVLRDENVGSIGILLPGASAWTVEKSFGGLPERGKVAAGLTVTGTLILVLSSGGTIAGLSGPSTMIAEKLCGLISHAGLTDRGKCAAESILTGTRAMLCRLEADPIDAGEPVLGISHAKDMASTKLGDGIAGEGNPDPGIDPGEGILGEGRAAVSSIWTNCRIGMSFMLIPGERVK